MVADLDTALELSEKLNTAAGIDNKEAGRLVDRSMIDYQPSPAAQKTHELYEKFKSNIIGDLHNILWQILVNEKHKTSAFYGLLSNNEIVLASPEGGYTETNLRSIYKERYETAKELNEAVFNLKPTDAALIINLSLLNNGLDEKDRLQITESEQKDISNIRFRGNNTGTIIHVTEELGGARCNICGWSSGVDTNRSVLLGKYMEHQIEHVSQATPI